jgi:hypothetical protein
MYIFEYTQSPQPAHRGSERSKRAVHGVSELWKCLSVVKGKTAKMLYKNGQTKKRLCFCCVCLFAPASGIRHGTEKATKLKTHLHTFRTLSAMSSLFGHKKHYHQSATMVESASPSPNQAEVILVGCGCPLR